MTHWRSLVLCCICMLAFLVPSLTFGADEAKQASGKFHSKSNSFPVNGALAYWARSDDGAPLIEVAVSNEIFVPAPFHAFYDPRPAIEAYFVDEQTAVVYFQFEPNGKYHGMHYYLGSGDGCGFCFDSKLKSTVKLVGQRLRGRLTLAEENREFDIEIDAPVPPKEWGKALPGDGGDPGSAFRAYNTAMDAGNRKAILNILDANSRATWAKREHAGKLDQYLDYRTEKQHWRLKNARITSGFVRENQAVLLVKGNNPLIDHIHGQVTLTKENGAWKISDEVYEAGE